MSETESVRESERGGTWRMGKTERMVGERDRGGG